MKEKIEEVIKVGDKFKITFGYGYIKFFDEEKKGIRCATTFYKRAIDIFVNDNNYTWKEGK